MVERFINKKVDKCVDNCTFVDIVLNKIGIWRFGNREKTIFGELIFWEMRR